MPTYDDTQSGAKTLLITALSILASLNLSNVDKEFLGRILLYIGYVFITDAVIGEREISEKSTLNQMEELENRISVLSKQMEILEKKNL